MNTILDNALALWHGPLPADDAAALDAFRAVYTDPVCVNGTAAELTTLVERARQLQAAFADLHHEILDEVAVGDRMAFAFRLAGLHTGPLTTPFGVVPASDRHLCTQGMDIFVLRDGRVAAAWAVADQLALLMQSGALDGFTPAGTSPPACARS